MTQNKAPFSSMGWFSSSVKLLPQSAICLQSGLCLDLGTVESPRQISLYCTSFSAVHVSLTHSSYVVFLQNVSFPKQYVLMADGS